MSERRPQTLANHAKFDPLFHFFLAPVLLGCFIASIVFLFHGLNALHIWLAVFSLGCVSARLQNPRICPQGTGSRDSARRAAPPLGTLAGILEDREFQS